MSSAKFTETIFLLILGNRGIETARNNSPLIRDIRALVQAMTIEHTLQSLILHNNDDRLPVGHSNVLSPTFFQLTLKTSLYEGACNDNKHCLVTCFNTSL